MSEDDNAFMKATCIVAEWVIIRNQDLISLLVADQSTFECGFVRAYFSPFTSLGGSI